jgi:hypothetical protein
MHQRFKSEGGESRALWLNPQYLFLKYYNYGSKEPYIDTFKVFKVI